MALEYQIQSLMGPAMQMCATLGELPYVAVVMPSGAVMPRWEAYATRMAEHMAMVDALRCFGMGSQ